MPSRASEYRFGISLLELSAFASQVRGYVINLFWVSFREFPVGDNAVSQDLAWAWHGFINCIGHESKGDALSQVILFPVQPILVTIIRSQQADFSGSLLRRDGCFRAPRGYHL